MTNPLKVGLIGTGGISRRHVGAYIEFPEKVRLTAVCDVVEDAARERAKEAGVDAIYTDAEKMIKEADIDAVDICSPHALHLPHVVAAAQAGKHVLVEKAMANTMQDCRDMIEATDKAGVTFMVAQHLRHTPSARTVRAIIESGELGTIRAARTDVIMNATGTLRDSHWMLDGKPGGGGVGITNTIHLVDLLRYFIGNVKTVSAVSKMISPRLINNAEDHLCATLEFENGAVGTVFCLWTVSRSPWGTQYMLFGDEGSLHTISTRETRTRRAAGDQVGPIMVSSPTRDNKDMKQEGLASMLGEFVEVPPIDEGLPHEQPIINEILHFAECCQEGKEPISSGKDNLNTMKIVLGMYESARTGTVINLADF